MRIVLNHITRMRRDRICIAGVDLDSRRHVRPTTSRTELLTRRLLAAAGGFVEPGVVVELGTTTPMPSPPEVEDHHCSLAALRRLGKLDDGEYLGLLDAVAEDTLEDVFGPDLERMTKWKYGVEPGRGSASLGVLRPQEQPDLELDRDGKKVTVRLNDEHPPAFVPVTDVRFFEDDHATPRQDRVDDVNRRLSRGEKAFLMVGLSRPFAKTGNLHWLQVNGICLADRPLGGRP